MPKSHLATITIRTNTETRDFFKVLFEGSGANSQGEFFQQMCERMNTPEERIEPKIETVTVEKPVLANEILLSLTSAQLYALRQTILSSDTFAQDQNEIIDELKPENRPLFYSGVAFSPEIQSLWIRNIVLSKTMTQEQREAAIKHNMGAFLVNRFLIGIIEGKISCTNVTGGSMKAFIKKQIEESKPKPVILPNKKAEDTLS